MKKLALVAVLATALTGCYSLNQGVTASALKTSVKADHEANVTVGGKVSGTSEATVLFGLFTVKGDDKFADGVNYAGNSLVSIGFGPTETVKAAAAYKAMASSKSDVLVAPVYVTEVTNYFLWKEIKVKVDAYKGTITGFRQVK